MQIARSGELSLRCPARSEGWAVSQWENEVDVGLVEALLFPVVEFLWAQFGQGSFDRRQADIEVLSNGLLAGKDVILEPCIVE